jgi:ribosome-associated toxin RatA of RatAB toxin-antitoxin module
MPTVYRTALVPYTAKAMFDLVADIETYPEFLPWCNSASVELRTEDTQLASVGIDAKFKQTTFTTRNQLIEGQEIQMALEDGPFKHLSGTWTFKALGELGCKVELHVEFEFASATLAALIEPAFTKVCDTIVSAFVTRASETLSH